MKVHWNMYVSIQQLKHYDTILGYSINNQVTHFILQIHGKTISHFFKCSTSE